MSSIDFYYMPESMPCRTVEMVANIIGVNLNKHYLDLSTGDHLKEDYIKINPLHKVPFIVDSNFKLGESRAIITYLVNKYKPNDSLYPSDSERRASIDEMLHYENGTLAPAAYKLFRPKLLGTFEEYNDDDNSAYRDILQHIDDKLSQSKGYLFGDDLTVADVSLCATLTFPEACGYDLSTFKNLTSYLERLRKAIPAYDEINAGPCQRMKKYIDSRQKS